MDENCGPKWQFRPERLQWANSGTEPEMVAAKPNTLTSATEAAAALTLLPRLCDALSGPTTVPSEPPRASPSAPTSFLPSFLSLSLSHHHHQRQRHLLAPATQI